ncbi:pseudaminic acid cytidylyltransferase [Parabacteroides distasonis]|uniref:pseudaminic acid cytidylyltransferase n=1 Tax=Parabacteroides distasonis TaxID=823 RepID=UPI00189DA769|nr:pseudaminic acid cytidylyltransferase [Parabacteroides distasonis]MDB9150307.1 pseudaminic acid cytidylyltransferase [Parabacteroides distasonis]MDB9154848.1 pseudaminic acid cytidylyltransferase [Parabacteroides distasonis]MDB9164564.1 pseudaminic acid cytidylyltransferase [Parabacteroides distasonis]MDB9168596.1 pseudaminic acid cytidylyltransferase [Parabacteroides distasonis]MDB9193162.1 pseudaminic acid cytidylyltransferase [Parabacteroides distasonis]
MKCLAIIPARGGSKRIPHKNIKLFLGRPIIAYSIEAALGTGLFEEVMVSTDDTEIAEIARQEGASVPFLRSTENANDYATLADVLVEVVNVYKERGNEFDLICCLLPTAPLISSEDVRSAYDQLVMSTFDSICPVVAFSYPILRSLSIDEKGNLNMNWPEYRFSRSQDLRPAYHDSGTFYWIKTSSLLKDKKLLGENGTAIVLDEFRVQDIDTDTDWALAEMKYKLLHMS